MPARRPTPAPFRLTLVVLEARETPAFAGGVNLAVGDVNGDGHPDVVAGQASGGSVVKVIDGKTGDEVLAFSAYEAAFTGGVSVAVGDLDGDGRAEIITGAGTGGGPLVRAFSGTSGALRLNFLAYEDTFRGGVTVAAADANGDGKAEIVTGTGAGGAPRVRVLDATTLDVLADFFAYEATFRGGVLVGAGDTTGDGKAEVVTGTGVGGGPRVQAFDLTTLAEVANFFAYEATFRGGVAVAAADTDGDGVAEILTGAGPGGGPVVTTFSADATPRARFISSDPASRSGVSVAGGDITGDGIAELVCGSGPGQDPKVCIFNPDGSANLLMFSPFDPVRLPAPDGLSARRGTPFVDATEPTDPLGLSVNAESVAVGFTESLVFTARPPGALAGTRVQLFASDSSGRAGEFLLDLSDDGSFTHRDATADDGIYSNTFAVNYTTAGDNYYLARVTSGDATSQYLVRVTAVAVPEHATVADRLTLANNTQARLNALIAGGTAATDAIAQLRAALMADPAVRSGSVRTSPAGLTWQTIEGMTFGALTTTGRYDLLADAAPVTGDVTGTGKTDPKGDDTTTAVPAGDGGRALVLSPFLAQFTPHDPTAQIANDLRDKGFEVVHRMNGAADVDSFKNFGQYDTVVVTTHGDESGDAGGVPVVLTGERVGLGSAVSLVGDLLAGRVAMVNGYFAVTPAFFEAYSGQMDGSIVYMGACRSAYSDELPSTFVRDLGATAYAGYTDYAYTDFAAAHGKQMYAHLLAGGTVGRIPGAGDTETRSLPEPYKTLSGDGHATFQVYGDDGKLNGKLTARGTLLRDHDLSVTYTWPTGQADLDTGTLFLGQSVGWSHAGSPYMTFSGDNRGVGGAELVSVDLYRSHRDGGWDASVPVTLRAGWYIPAGGSGPATVTVALKNKATGEVRQSVQRSIAPGAQLGAAAHEVGKAFVSISGPAGSERVRFTMA